MAFSFLIWYFTAIYYCSYFSHDSIIFYKYTENQRNVFFLNSGNNFSVQSGILSPQSSIVTYSHHTAFMNGDVPPGRRTLLICRKGTKETVRAQCWRGEDIFQSLQEIKCVGAGLESNQENPHVLITVVVLQLDELSGVDTIRTTVGHTRRQSIEL